MKKILKLLPGLLLSATVSAQLVESVGDLPRDFTYDYRIQLLDKYDDLDHLNVDFTDEDEAAKRLTRNEYVLHELLLSGDVIFGDPMTEYLNSVADRLLRTRPTLADQITVYTLKSYNPNAFMTADGKMFVTTALLAQVQNEAEIAFVMAHEIGHHANNDIARELQFDLGDNDGAAGAGISNRYHLLESYSYSRELETEADDFALELLKESEAYDPAEAIDVFDVLLYAYLPYDDVKFDPHWILPESVQVPQRLLINEVNPITAFEDYDDSESTHPNIKKRKERYMKALIESESTVANGAYPQGEDRFLDIQRMARVNVIRQDLQSNHYPRAIYNSFILASQDSSMIPFARKATGYALHGISAYKLDEEYGSITPDAEDTEGEIHQLYNLLELIRAEDAGVMALAYNFALASDYPEDLFIKTNYEAALHEVVRFHEKDLDDYTLSPEEAIAPMDSLSAEELDTLSKIEKIRYQQALKRADHRWITGILYDYRDNETLKIDFRTAKEQYEEDLERRDGISETGLRMSFLESNSDDDDYEDRNLGLDHVICLSPFVYMMDITEKDPVDVLRVEKTYEVRAEMDQIHRKVMDLLELEATYISPNEFHSGSTQMYNDYSTILAWTIERLSHTNVMVNQSLQTEATEIADRLGTDYVVVPLIMNACLDDKDLLRVASSILLPPLLPIILFSTLEANYSSLYACFVFDLRTGNALMVNLREYSARMNSDYSVQMVYDMMYQIAR